MKVKSFIAALLLMAAGLQTTYAQKVVLYVDGSQAYECSVSQLDSIVFVGTKPIIVGEHEWVDLGLPSGTLWATCNVGANSPEEYGDYFAWGETEPKEVYYDWSSYKYCNGSETTMTKYCLNSNYGIVDNKSELEPEDDAATVNWGSEWQMPSVDQQDELKNSRYTDITRITQNGVYGCLITSKSNGNSIFLPAAGEHNESAFSYKAGSVGWYWSRTLSARYSHYGRRLSFDWGSINTEDVINNRCTGFSVRPVRKQ